MSKEVVELRNAFLEKLQSVDPESLDAAELGERIKLRQSTIDLLQLQNAADVAVLDRRQGFLELGQTSTIDWLRANTNLSAAAADKQITLARQLPELAPTVEAVETGEIGFEHALAIAREVKDLPDSAQAELLEAAARSDPRELRQVGERIRHREDPEDADARAYRQFQKRRLRIFEHPDGMLGLEGALPAPEGMKLRLCLESLIGIPEKGDERTQEQRQADALAELCAVAIGSGRLPRRGGRVPQLTVIVRKEAIELEGVGPISEGTLSRLRSQDHVEREQLVGAGGVTLDFGRARRLFSEPQRQEIATRHPTCVVEGCTVPSRKCQPHHEEWWRDGGGTDVKRGLPLCWKHHPMVTEGGYRLAARPGGGFELARRLNRSG
jgi:uncharacterized protein DUF222